MGNKSYRPWLSWPLWALSFQDLAMLPSMQFPEMTSHPPPGALKHSSAWKFLLQLLTQKAPFNSQPQCWTDRLSLTAPFQVHNISCLFCITALCSPPSQPFPDFVRCSCMLVYQKITSSHPQQDPRPPRGVTWVPLTLEAQHPAEWPRSQNLWNNWADEKMDEWQRTFSNRFIPQLKKKK